MVKPTANKQELPKATLPLDTDTVYNLKVNKETQKFYIDDEDLDYGEFTEFTFRTLEVRNKLKAYDSDFKVKNETKFFSAPKDAADAQGGVGCGRKLYKNETKDMSEDELATNKAKASWYTYIFGIITPKGKNPIVCDYQIGGGLQMEVNSILNKVLDEKKEYHKAELKFNAVHNDEIEWPTVEVMADFSRDLPVSGLEPIYDTINQYITEHNDKIDVKAAKYKKFGGKPFVKKAFKKKY